MLETLKKDVWEANLKLVEYGLVIDTWGNVSGIDRGAGLVVIKPSGLAYDAMQPADMTVVELDTGKAAEGAYKPSSDTPTHLELYRRFSTIGGVAHTHSLYATAWAQSRSGIPAFGTTHADYFRGEIPCTKMMSAEQIAADYEANAGKVIVERFFDLNPEDLPGVLVAAHGPFAWGPSAMEAAHSARILEHLARLACLTRVLSPNECPPIPQALLDKHFFRKHGASAYYGPK